MTGASSTPEVRDICFGSPKSGLLSVIPPEDVAKYNSSLGETTLRLKNGTLIRGFGAETPDNLRGWAFDKAWCDEYAAWSRHTAQEVYDMIWFCLREADTPQVVISTTPKPLPPHVKRLVERGRTQEKARQEGAEPPGVVLRRGHGGRSGGGGRSRGCGSLLMTRETCSIVSVPALWSRLQPTTWRA
ncbi:terminase family protein [Streptomyces sp. NPDC001250]|uniref:terminase large subunit domain-containing protein n=1 Tax=unclassified Streptomyces TaxID=2593676 RepID=UPI0033189E64